MLLFYLKVLYERTQRILGLECFSCPTTHKKTFENNLHLTHKFLSNNQIQMSRTYHIPVSSDQSSSRAISLPATHIPRTQSEQQLRDDTAAAEWRDLCMFHRLVGGIRERQVDRWRRRQTYISSPSGAECDKMIEQSIASIVRHHREDLQTDIEDDYFIEDKNTSLFEYNNQMSSVCNIPFYDDDEPLETSDNDDDDVFTMDL